MPSKLTTVVIWWKRTEFTILLTVISILMVFSQCQSLNVEYLFNSIPLTCIVFVGFVRVCQSIYISLAIFLSYQISCHYIQRVASNLCGLSKCRSCQQIKNRNVLLWSQLLLFLCAFFVSFLADIQEILIFEYVAP